MLPDLEALAIVAKVAETRSFAAAAADLALSKATVSKAVSRLEVRLGTRLFNRTSRRLAITEAGRRLAERAARVLAEGEAAESEALAQSSVPRGTVRLAAPMSFGLTEIAPLLPEFMALYPQVTIDLNLSDQVIDLIGEGFDAALRISVLPDSSLVARRLCDVAAHVVAAPSYWDRRGRPVHPLHLADHACLGYSYQRNPGIWSFSNAKGEQASVRIAGPLRANSGDALMPALLAGLGVALEPDFIVREALADGRLESALTDWVAPAGGLHLVMPPGGPRPARIEVLIDFLADRLARRERRAGSKGPR